MIDRKQAEQMKGVVVEVVLGVLLTIFIASVIIAIVN